MTDSAFSATAPARDQASGATALLLVDMINRFDFPGGEQFRAKAAAIVAPILALRQQFARALYRRNGHVAKHTRRARGIIGPFALQHLRGQVGRVPAAEFAVALAAGGTGCGDDVGLCHGVLLGSWVGVVRCAAVDCSPRTRRRLSSEAMIFRPAVGGAGRGARYNHGRAAPAQPIRANERTTP